MREVVKKARKRRGRLVAVALLGLMIVGLSVTSATARNSVRNAASASAVTATNDSCGYAAFPESTVVVGTNPISGGTATQGGRIIMYYNDEHVLTMGIRSVTKTVSGATVTSLYKVSNAANRGDPFITTAATHLAGPLQYDSGTGAAPSASAGASPANGGVDVAIPHRPVSPVMFLTDLTANGAGSKVGDFQSGGTPQLPSDLWGLWKSGVRNQSGTTNTTTIDFPNDTGAPTNVDSNGFLKPGGLAGSPEEASLLAPNPLPSGAKGIFTNDTSKFAAEVVWNVDDLKDPGTNGSLQEGHVYRVQFMTHDGDQNKGGDAGEVCITVKIAGKPPLPTDPTGGADPNGGNVNGHIRQPIDSTIKDTAFLLPSAGFGDVTGKVTFNLYFIPGGDSAQPADLTTACNGTPVFTETKDLTVAADHSFSSATSSGYDTTGKGFGTYYWQDTYNPNGNPNYKATTEVCGSETDQMVDARIRLTPHEKTNIVGSPHTVTVTVESTTDGTSFSPAGSVLVATNLLPAGTSAFYVGNSSCTTASSGAGKGTCTVTINDNSIETVFVHAKATGFSIVGMLGTFTRETDSSGPCHTTDAANPGPTCDSIKHYINPKTELTVGDRLIGLGADATGTVTYTAYSTLSDCANGLNPTPLTPGNNTVTGGVAPASLTLTVDPGQTYFFVAHYEGNEGTLTTACSAESAQSS
jgi:hypothetical protein